MDFSTPEMEGMVSRHAYNLCCIDAGIISRCPSVWYFDLSAMHVNYAAVVMLSYITLALANCISTSFCSTNYCKRTTAISKYNFLGKLAGCALRLIQLRWTYITLISRRTGLPVSSHLTILLLLLLCSHHSNHRNDHILKIILWRESVGKLMR